MFSGWTPYVYSGELKEQRYIQVYFPNKMYVDNVEVIQTGAARATKIKLAYSNDGKSFLDGDTVRRFPRATCVLFLCNV